MFLRSLFLRSATVRRAVLGALVALPLALSAPAFAGETTKVRKKRSPMAGLAWKGERHDARSRIQQHYHAAERRHHQRMQRLMKKRSPANAAEIDRAMRAEQRRHEAKMAPLELKYRLAIFGASVRGSERETKRALRANRKKMRLRRGQVNVRAHRHAAPNRAPSVPPKKKVRDR